MKIQTTSRLLTLLVAVLSVVSMATLLFAGYCYDQRLGAHIRYQQAMRAVRQLAQGSDILTDNVRAYAATGNERYHAAFKTEQLQTRSRDLAMARLRELGASPHEMALLEEAKRLSDALIALEDRIFATAAQGDLAAAAALAYGPEYRATKARIMAPIRQALTQFEEHQREDIAELTARASLASYVALAAISLNVLVVLAVLFGFYRRHIVLPLIRLTEQTRLLLAGERTTEFGVEGEADEIATLCHTLDDYRLTAVELDRKSQGLTAANQEMQAIFDSATSGIILTRDGAVARCNNRTYELLGYPPGSLAGQAMPFAEAADRDAYASLPSGGVHRRELEMIRHGGGRIWVRLSGNAVDVGDPARGVVWVLDDITTERAAAAALRASQSAIERLSHWKTLLLDSAGDGIYGVGLDGRCTFINPAALTMLGYAEAEVLGQDQHELFHHHRPDHSPYPVANCPIRLTLQDGITRRQEETFLRKDGEPLPVLLSVTPIIESGRLIGAEVVFQDISQRKQMEAELRRLATTDSLTGLANRRHFVQALDLELARIKRQPGASAALLMFDIDHFKRINDTFGHAGGDTVLKTFCARLNEPPLRKNDLAGRLGGEEFAVLLPGVVQDNAMIVAERLRRRIGDTGIDLGGQSVAVTVSIGVATLSAADASPDDALGRADMALYAAKGAGRNRVVGWLPGLGSQPSD